MGEKDLGLTMQTAKIWTVTVEEDPNNPESLILPFPPELLEQAGWTVGDTIVWDIKEDGRIFLTKK